MMCEKGDKQKLYCYMNTKKEDTFQYPLSIYFQFYYLASQPKALAPNTAASLSFNSEGTTFTLPL